MNEAASTEAKMFAVAPAASLFRTKAEETNRAATATEKTTMISWIIRKAFDLQGWAGKLRSE